MDDDALVPSLIARVRALEDILDGMDARIERTWAQLRDEGRAEVILRRALTAGVPSPRHAARRDRHGLHVVQGIIAAAVLCAAWGAWHGGTHRVALAVARHLLGW